MRKMLTTIACLTALAGTIYPAKTATQPASSSAQKSTSSASSPSRFGVDFSYSESMPHLGAWWHLNPMIALRPTLGFRNETTTTTTNTGFGTSTSETSSTIFQFGLSLPIYLANFKALDLFVAPAFSFKSTSSKTTSGGTSTSASASGFDIGASLGLQLPLHEQFHVFGEMGFGYAKDDNTKQTVIGLTRTSIGAIFYFN